MNPSPTPSSPPILPPASRTRRALAAAIDMALLLVPVGVLLVDDGLIMIAALGWLAVTVANLRWLHMDGQTIGKRMLGIAIRRRLGQRATLGWILVKRHAIAGLISSVPYVGVLFAVANHLFIFGADRRCLHDHIADTIVVRV